MFASRLITACLAAVLGAILGAVVFSLPATDSLAADRAYEASDKAAVEDCLAASAGDFGKETRCIGVAYSACEKEPDSASTAGMVGCAAREEAVWDEMLNAHYGALRKLFSADAADKLRDMQRTWIEWRDAKCEMPYLVHEGGSIARPMLAYCRMEATALRSMELGQVATEMQATR